MARLDQLKTRPSTAELGTATLLVDYYVDEENKMIRTEDVQAALKTLSSADGGSILDKKIIFVSGPEGLINYWAGPKQWTNGTETQGPLRGQLSTLDLNGWEVVKL